ncbi:PP2C family protein-serine/threonine phosphatase [Streptomyces sp. NPDC057148]|uniref:PP2C family protein-serine/threonine phosphatase n=1 Tax=unclassified Streptomyces TaxID=2593676 RepID=UPI00362FEDA1
MSDDAVLGRLLRQIHDMAPADLPEVLRGHYPALGVTRLTVYLADLQENVLVAMPDAQASPVSDLAIDGTLAGWTYRGVSPRISADENGEGLTLWLPLLDGVERVGVLKVQATGFDRPRMLLCESLASLITLIVLDKAGYSDDYATAMRVQPMSLPAEMVWAFLPSRTIGTGQVTSSAVLEPAYELGGDAFEHGLIGHFLHAAVFDAMGHDLQAGLTSSVALAASRNTRRRGADLTDIVHAIDQAVSDAFPDRYATAVLTRLDLVTGHLTWSNCGHPAPLLIRDAEVVPAAMERAGELPLGLGAVRPDMTRTLHHLQLEPGDRILLYTDGVTDARAHTGERFGEGGFADFIIRAMAAGEPAPEALRRLMRTLLTHKQQGQLTDDATIVLFEWHPAAPPGTRPSGV